MKGVVRTGAVLGGLAIVFVGGLAIASVVLPPFLDALVPPPVVLLSPSPSAGPTPTMGILMNGVAISEDSNCEGCHEIRGGVGRVLEMPALAHPVEGWRHCNACHADERLVPTAAGHEGLTEDLCLACHRERDADDPPNRPHHVFEGQDCTSCHNGGDAPLPEQMEARTTCWLCHHDTPGASSFPSTPPSD